MTATDVKHMHEDLEILKRDVALIKHILTEEGELSEEAVSRLEKSRKTPLSQFKRL